MARSLRFVPKALGEIKKKKPPFGGYVVDLLGR